MPPKDEKAGSKEFVRQVTTHEEATKTIPREERLKEFKKAGAAPIQAEKVKPKIQRVPFMLRDNKDLLKYYEPRVAAVGPVHHGRKPKYEHAEKLKLKLAANFVKDSIQNEADLLKKVDDKINELRKCYDEEVTKDYGDEFLAWMLFVDGCSTLEFIYKYENLEDFQIKRDQVAFVEQDLFLLENQLPYQLLQLLMSSSQIRKELEKKIDYFVRINSVAVKQRSQPGQDVAITMEAAEPAEPAHLLELLLTRMLGRSPSYKSKKTEDANLPHYFRNVQELQAAGIQFESSEANSLRSIYFRSPHLGRGVLYLPQIEVDDSTRPKFMNLIAYEMCPDFHNDYGVTTYICFLDSIIDHPDDVKHLRKKQILLNLLGNDEEVAKVFNEIGTDLVPNNDIYRPVKDQIEKYYSNRLNTEMAEFFHEHFSSTWTVVAFLGVLLALGLTIVQTVYSVLGYHPDKK